jgi:predicted  nucleic acid-binding Zn-ribbon protein
MANQHMITAASNLQNALTDINSYKNELKINLEKSKHNADERLKHIDIDITRMRQQLSSEGSDQMKAHHQNQIRALEQEKAQIAQQLGEEQRMVENQLRTADNNSAKIAQFVSSLQMMA